MYKEELQEIQQEDYRIRDALVGIGQRQSDNADRLGSVISAMEAAGCFAPPNPPTGNLVVSYQETQITNNVGSDVYQHFYSKRQAFNADESLIYIYENTAGGPGSSYFVNLQGEVVYRGSPFFRAHIWHITDPYLMYGCVGNTFGVSDIRTGMFMPIYSYTKSNGTASSEKLLIGQWEGQPDNQQRYFPLNSSSEMMVLDLASEQIKSRLPKASGYNWHGISDSGEHVVSVEGSNWQAPLRIFDIDFNHKHTNNSSSHDDFTLINGRDFLVKIGTTPRMIDLETNEDIILGESGNGSAMQGHFSGQGPDDLIAFSIIGSANHPGWPNNSLGTFKPSEGLSSPEVWGVHGSSSSSYNRQPKATISRSGTKMIYTSDKSGIPQDYLIERVVTQTN